MRSADHLFGLALGAVLHPERLAVADEFGVTYSYAELDQVADRLIHSLTEGGMTEGDVFALLLDNRSETIALHQAAYRGGFLYTPINPRLRTAEIEYLLTDSGAKYLFVDQQYLDLITPIEDGLTAKVVVVGGLDGSWDGFSGMTSGGDVEPVDYRFGGMLSYTSGTTGQPKAVIRDRSKPTTEVMKVIARFGERLGFDPDHDRHLATAPLYHGGPLISAMHVINLQGSVYLMQRFDPELVLKRIEEFSITSAYMVPTMYHRIMRLPQAIRESADLKTLRSVMHTGAPCPPDLKRQMIEWLGPIVYECYAATEALGTYTVCTSEQWLAHPGTVGKPEHDVITIRGEDGEPLPAGQVGLVFARTLPGVNPFEYKGDPAKTARAYGREGDYTVGDMGYLDDDGYLYLTGRASDMIISGGVNIYPAEVEQAILKHPAVRDVAVFGAPDEEWGERVVAAVQASDPTLTPEEVIGFARESVASYKGPREVYIVDDLGRDPSGKLRKSLLRERLIGGSS